MNESQNDAEEFKEKYEAIRKWLEEYREFESDVKYSLGRLDQHEARMTSIGSPVISDMPKASGRIGDRTSELVARKLELEEEVDDAVLLRNERRKEMKEIIKHLKKANERIVLKLRYIDLLNVYDTADMLYGDNDDFLDRDYTYMRRAQEIQRSALENLVRYLDNIGKDPRQMI